MWTKRDFVRLFPLLGAGLLTSPTTALIGELGNPPLNPELERLIAGFGKNLTFDELMELASVPVTDGETGYVKMSTPYSIEPALSHAVEALSDEGEASE